MVRRRMRTPPRPLKGCRVNIRRRYMVTKRTRECIADVGDELRCAGTLYCDAVVEVVGGLSEPHPQDEERRDALKDVSRQKNSYW